MRRFALKSEEKMLLRDRSVKEGEAQHAHFAGLDISVRQTRSRGDDEGDCRLERKPLVTMRRLGVFAEQDTRRKELRK